MRILFAGASGVIGRHALPLLVAARHEVHAAVRSRSGRNTVRRLGAHPVWMDVLDAGQAGQVVGSVAPDAVVNMLTDLYRPPDPARLDRSMAGTNLLRTVATDALLAACAASGVQRYVGQSVAGWFSEPPSGVTPAPLLADPPRRARETVAALAHLEQAVASLPGGVVLRLGPLYGPGTSMGRGGTMLAQVRRRRFPVVGDGAGVWSFCHVDDAARAIAAALGRTGAGSATGVVEVVDDDPAPVAVWLPALAAAVGSPSPRRVPAWLARPLVGGVGLHLMTATGGASTRPETRLPGWTPARPSWREGFLVGLGAGPVGVR
jgi:nucleoside-diphosphate-sugar epimerase